MDGDELSPHLIYHPSSPGFDIPDYLPPLRRVKPLPKRKHNSSSSPDLARSLPLNTTMLPPILPPPPGPDATAEELIAHAEVLSAQITFQSYFLPALTDVADFATAATTINSRSVDGMTLAVDPSHADLDLDVTPLINEGRENDHTDQTQQQGNAKKRKVPAHLSGSQMGPDSADVHSSEEEEKLQPGGEKVPPSGSPAASAAVASPEEELFQSGAEGGDGHQGQGKLLPATMVGLRKKQVLKHRRRQLAGLLGSLSLGDSLALDQALLANHALVNEKRSGAGGGNNDSNSSSRNARHKSRLKRSRRASRVVRRHRTLPPRPPSEPTPRIFPDSEFTFLSSNAGVSFGIVSLACVRISDRLI